MRSGIKPDEKLIEEYKDLRYNRKIKCMILGINESNLEITFKGDDKFCWKDLDSNLLPGNEPRFIFFDFGYQTNENPPIKTNKLICIFWCPLLAPAKKRFTYTSTLSDVVNTLGAVQKQFQAADLSDLEYEVIRKQLL